MTMAKERKGYAATAEAELPGEMPGGNVSPSAEAAALRQHRLATPDAQAPDDEELDWAVFNAEGLSASPLL